MLRNGPRTRWFRRCSATSRSSRAGSEAMRPTRNCCTSAISRCLFGLSFGLHQGEILGIAGLVGAGRTEVLRCIAGAEPSAEGAMRFAGMDCPWPRTIREAIGRGIVLAPEDRKRQGLVLSRSSLSNLMLADLHAVATGPVIDRSKARMRGETLAR